MMIRVVFDVQLTTNDHSEQIDTHRRLLQAQCIHLRPDLRASTTRRSLVRCGCARKRINMAYIS